MTATCGKMTLRHAPGYFGPSSALTLLLYCLAIVVALPGNAQAQLWLRNTNAADSPCVQLGPDAPAGYPGCLQTVINQCDWSLATTAAAPTSNQSLWWTPASAGSAPVQGTFSNSPIASSGSQLCLTAASATTLSPVMACPCANAQWKAWQPANAVWNVSGAVQLAGTTLCLAALPGGAAALGDCASATHWLAQSPTPSVAVLWSSDTNPPSAVSVLSDGVQSPALAAALHSARLSVPPGLQVTIAANAGTLATFFSDAGPLELPMGAVLSASRLPGVALFEQSAYRGAVAFLALGTISANAATLVPAPLGNVGSILISQASNAVAVTIWSARQFNSSDAWTVRKSAPDTTTAAAAGALGSVRIVQTGCPAECSGRGVCRSDGTCLCSVSGWTGSACDQCADGFYGPQCAPCLSACQASRGIHAGCDSGRNATGACLCAPGWTGAQCNQCAPGYNGPNCAPVTYCGFGVYVPSQQQCVCPPGYMSQIGGANCTTPVTGTTVSGVISTGAAFPVRTACYSGCLSCANATLECLACTPGTVVQADGRTCSGAPSGTPSMCQTAIGTPPYCTMCVAHTYPDHGTCVTTGTDGSCGGWRYQSTTPNPTVVLDGFRNSEKGQCDPCVFPCATCTSSTTCTSCIPGFLLVSGLGTCVAACPNGYTSTDGTTCTQCSATAGCATCAPGSPSYCTTCTSAGSVAVNGTCVTQTPSACPAGSFVAPNYCALCSSSCASCSGNSPQYCTACAGGWPATTGQCDPTCPIGSFSATGTCQSCNSTCDQCVVDSDECVSCPLGRVLLQGVCLAACPFGWYADQSGVCLPCAASCAACSGPSVSQCTACASGAQLAPNGSCALPASSVGSATTITPTLATPAPVSNSTDLPSTNDPGSPNTILVAAASGAAGTIALAGALLFAVRRYNRDRNKERTQKKVTEIESNQAEHRVERLQSRLALDHAYVFEGNALGSAYASMSVSSMASSVNNSRLNLLDTDRKSSHHETIPLAALGVSRDHSSGHSRSSSRNSVSLNVTSRSSNASADKKLEEMLQSEAMDEAPPLYVAGQSLAKTLSQKAAPPQIALTGTPSIDAEAAAALQRALETAQAIDNIRVAPVEQSAIRDEKPPLEIPNQAAVLAVALWRDTQVLVQRPRVPAADSGDAIDREARLLAAAGRRTDKVVRVLGVLQDATVPSGLLLSMYAGDLNALVHDPGVKLSLSLCMQLFGNVAAGVEALHELDVVHTALCAACVLVEHGSGGYRAVVSTLGPAVVLSQRHRESTTDASRDAAARNLCYVAPELLCALRSSTTVAEALYALPARRAAFAADVYSLGILLGEMLTRRVPYEDTLGLCIPTLDAVYALVVEHQVRPSLGAVGYPNLSSGDRGKVANFMRAAREAVHEDAIHRPSLSALIRRCTF